MAATTGKKNWTEAWKEGKTGWDLGGPTPALSDLLENTPSDVSLPSSGSGLVPGCGAGYDVVALAQALPGVHVRGMDLADVAKEKFESYLASTSPAPENAGYLVGDFFGAVENGVLDAGSMDLIYDYTFLCAIEPEMRESWADTMASLLKPAPESRLVVLVFPTSPKEGQNPPPHQITPDIVSSLLEPRGFTCEHIQPVPESITQSEWRKGKEIMSVWIPPQQQ